MHGSFRYIGLHRLYVACHATSVVVLHVMQCIGS